MLLGTSADALRRLIERRAKIVRGVLEARFDGIRAWKRDRKWVVALGGAWLCEGSNSRWLGINKVAASLNRTASAVRKALERCAPGCLLRLGQDVFCARRLAGRWRLIKRAVAPAGAHS
jgi:hypothetical protein